MGRFTDLTGQKFGRLTVVSRTSNSGSGKIRWNCLCECGGSTISYSSCLKGGHAQSCGCYKLERIKEVNTKHGQSNKTSEYRSWNMMKRRCDSPNFTDYKYWGGRGIKVCDRWLGEKGFENFFEDMGPKPSANHSLDRFPDKNGDYSPYNCRWGTEEQQNQNRRNNIFMTFRGRTKVMAAWAREMGVSHSNLKRMLLTKSFEDTYSFYYNKQLSNYRQTNFFVMNIN